MENQYFRIRWVSKEKRCLGIVVPKRVGKATRRNLIKRIVRECFRLHPQKFPMGDVVVVAKKASGFLKRRAIWISLKDSLEGKA